MLETVGLSTKSKILSFALERFLKQGHEHVSMRQIASDVGITPMAIYKHYENKEALQIDLLEVSFSLFEEYLGRFKEGKNSKIRLRLLAEGFFDFSIEQPGYFELIFLCGRSLLGVNVWEEARSASQPTYRVLNRCIQDCINEEIIENSSSKRITTSMLAFCVGVSALYLSSSVNWSKDNARENFLQHFDNYLNQLRPREI